MASLLKMDIKDLFKSKKSNSEGDGSEVNKILLTRISLIILLIIILFIGYWFYLKPKNELQQFKINQLQNWEQQLINCDIEIENLRKKEVSLIEYKNQKGKLFVTSEEFENFYSDLTEATVNYELRILDITRLEEEQVFADNIDMNLSLENNITDNNDEAIYLEGMSCAENLDQSLQDLVNNQNQTNTDAAYNNENCEENNRENCQKVAYSKMLVDYEIRGNFMNYIKFRNNIASEQKIVNIEKEEILEDVDEPGFIIARATVSLVKTP